MIPIQITIRDIPGSQALEENICKKAEKLSQLYRQIKNCHVVVGTPQKHKHQGKLFSVHIDLDVPGKELVVDCKQDEDVYIAVAKAFNALKRQVSDYVHRRRGNVKHHHLSTKRERANLLMEEEDVTIVH
jgi:ribosomal subunit interface protein